VSDSGAGSSLETLSKGDVFDAFEVCLTSDDVSAYLAATGEVNAAWEANVPPLAIGAAALGGLMDRIGVPEGLLHTGQEFDFLRPVGHGAPVEVRIAVASHSERRGALMAAFDMEFVAGGATVGTGRTSVIVAPPEDGGSS